MEVLRVAPNLSAEDNHLRGQTGWFVRLLALFSYVRSVDVDRHRRRITITTVRLWILRQERLISFDEVSRILCLAQGVPSLLFWRYLSTEDSGYESAWFMISLILKDGREVPLFTVWEQQPRPKDWLDRLAGGPSDDSRVGDETAVGIVDLLREYLAVPIARH